MNGTAIWLDRVASLLPKTSASGCIEGSGCVCTYSGYSYHCFYTCGGKALCFLHYHGTCSGNVCIPMGV